MDTVKPTWRAPFLELFIRGQLFFMARHISVIRAPQLLTQLVIKLLDDECALHVRKVLGLLLETVATP